jgi:hypothetical protein
LPIFVARAVCGQYPTSAARGCGLVIAGTGLAQNDLGIPSTCVATYDKIRFVEIGATW